MAGGTPNGGIIGKTNNSSFGKNTITSKPCTGTLTTQPGTRVVRIVNVAGGGGGSGPSGGGGGAGGLMLLIQQLLVVEELVKNVQ